ncbi:hypothetical protein GCM10010350_74570 [Streptomyces galilaeus]|nr:hypothetical protein GCM10010350_74570 [Streptomyces galilaeus]
MGRLGHIRKGECARGLAAPAQQQSELDDQVEEGGAHGGAVQNVPVEGAADGCGSGQGAGDNGAGVDAAGAVGGQAACAAAQEALHGGRVDGGEQSHGVDAVIAERVGLAGADAVQGVDRQRASQWAAWPESTTRTPPSCAIWAETVAATVMDGPMPTRTATPSRERVRTRPDLHPRIVPGPGQAAYTRDDLVTSAQSGHERVPQLGTFIRTQLGSRGRTPTHWCRSRPVTGSSTRPLHPLPARAPGHPACLATRTVTFTIYTHCHRMVITFGMLRVLCSHH